MKKYSIFYKENGNYYPVYESKGKFYLGGARVSWLLFSNKAEAERVAKLVRKQKLPFFEKGTIKVYLAKLQEVIQIWG